MIIPSSYYDIITSVIELLILLIDLAKGNDVVTILNLLIKMFIKGSPSTTISLHITVDLVDCKLTVLKHNYT